MTEIVAPDTRWSVICLTEDGKQLSAGLTKDEAIATKRTHEINSRENPREGLTTLHMAEVKHPELARDLLNMTDVITSLGVEGTVSALMALTTNLLLIDEFFERYPKVPKSAIKQPSTKHEGLWGRIFYRG